MLPTVWSCGDERTGHQVVRESGTAVRSILTCGLLLLTLPISSSDVHTRCLDQQSSQPNRGMFSPECLLTSRSAEMPGVACAFVRSWVVGGVNLRSAPQVCRRPLQAGLGERQWMMVSAQSRSDTMEESSTQTKTRKTEAMAIGGEATPTPAPRRRRGIGSKLASANTAKQPGTSTSLQAMAIAAGGSTATVLRNSKEHPNDGFPNSAEARRNKDALVRQATLEAGKEGEASRQEGEASRLHTLFDRGIVVDDMTGGARLGEDPYAQTASAQRRRVMVPKPRPNSRLYTQVAEDEESVTDAMVAEQTSYQEEFSQDVELDWQAQKKSVKKPMGATGRWRSRLRSMRPEDQSSEFAVLETEHVEEVGRLKQVVNQELIRKVTILTKGRAQGNTASVPAEEDEKERDLFLNPGFIYERREANERAAMEGGMLSGIALSELGRRGLVGRARSSQDLHRGGSALDAHVELGGAVFDLKVVGGRLYCAGADNCVSMYDTSSWKKLGRLEGHAGWVNALAVDEKRNILYSASEDKSVKVWDLTTLQCIETLEGHDDGAVSLQILDGRLVVGCTGKMVVWDTKTWTVLDKLTNHSQVLRAMTDGKQLSASLNIDPRMAMAREAARLVGLKVSGLAASARHLFSAVDDGSIWVWDLKHLEVERKLLGPISNKIWVRSLEVIQVAHPKTGKLCQKLISGWADGALRVYDLHTWALEHTLTAHSGPILSLTVVADTVISTGADTTAAEWDPTTWTLNRVLRNHDGAVCAASSLPDGRVLTASLDGKLKVWKVEQATANKVEQATPATPAKTSVTAVSSEWTEGGAEGRRGGGAVAGNIGQRRAGRMSGSGGGLSRSGGREQVGQGWAAGGAPA